MRLAALASLLALALPPAAAPQSLGETAKKERERREKARQAGTAPAPTVDADQLAGNKGALANDTKQAPAAGAQADKPATSPQKVSDPKPVSGEEYWRSRATNARQRVEVARSRVDAFDRMIRFGQPEQTDENGRIVLYSLQQLKRRADAAAAELEQAQAALEALLDEGRRAGALPGWLR